MRADLRLKERQSIWETPKAIAAIIAALAVTIGAIGGVIGYQIGARPAATITVHLDAPLVVPAQK